MLPFELKDSEYWKIHPFKEVFEVLIQNINIKSPETLELYNCQILSNKNHYSPFIKEYYLKRKKEK